MTRPYGNTFSSDPAKTFEEQRNIMTTAKSYSVSPIGFIRSTLNRRGDAPRQGQEGAPDAWLEVRPRFAEGRRRGEISFDVREATR